MKWKGRYKRTDCEEMGFRNEIFHFLSAVLDRLYLAIRNLSAEIIRSITGIKWILSCFEQLPSMIATQCFFPLIGRKIAGMNHGTHY